MKQIAHIRSLYTSKFGIPRQAGIIDSPAQIIFEPDYRNPDAVRGLEGFDYIWLVWKFSQSERDTWSPTVRPPRLGGNRRIGVFATRSPFRPNPIGLSSVRLLRIETDPRLGPVLHISGADLLDGTPIFDIKPYLAYADAHPDARSGFAPTPENHLLQVVCPDPLSDRIPDSLRSSLFDILAHDPRPQYQHQPDRIYHLEYGPLEVAFQVDGDVLTLCDILTR